MLINTEENIFETEANVLINPVNCVGVMGAGLAKQFKENYPDMFKAYAHACRYNGIDIGRPFFYDIGCKWIICFPTKEHWKNPSRLEYIDSGLVALRSWLIECAKDGAVMYVAMPKIGCGLGGLDWDDVQPLIAKYLDDVCNVYICDPPEHRMKPRHIDNQCSFEAKIRGGEGV